MNQLALAIRPKLSYAPDNFVVHAGVEKVVDEAHSLLSAGFGCCFLSGGEQSGKTHLSIFLADSLTTQGRYPILVEGAGLHRFIESRLELAPPLSDTVFLIDDAHRYFSRVLPGASGPFVAFMERLRNEGGAVAFLSALALSDLPCDEHVMSRLYAGGSSYLEAPGDEDMPELIESIALQRGIRISPKKRQYLVSRLRRSVPEIAQYLDRTLQLLEVTNEKLGFSLLGDAIAGRRFP